jgi:O-antigen/teichoic acid export membrane protein
VATSPDPSRPGAPDTSLGQLVVGGGAALVALTVSLHALAAVRLVVLAHLLEPGEFGLVAAVQALLVLLDALSALSIGSALVRERAPVRRLVDTAWTLEVIRGALQAGVLFLLAPALAAFVSAPQVAPIAQAMALVPLIAGLGNVGVVEFTRELRVRRLCWLQLSASLTDFVVSVSLGLVLHSAWALVAGYVARDACRVAASYALHPYRPRLRVDRDAARELVAFGRWTLAAAAARWTLTSGVPLAISRALGLPVLGAYQMAWRIVSMPIQELGGAAAQVTLPAYSRLWHEPRRVAAAFERVLRIVALLLVPSCAWLAASHDVLVAVLLGPRWSAVGPLLPLLALAALARCLTTIVVPLMRAASETWKEAVVAALELTAVTVLLPVLLGSDGARGAALAVALAALSSTTAAFVLGMRGLGVGLRTLLRGVGGPLAAAIPIPLVGTLVLGAAPGWFALIGSLLGCAVAFLAVTAMLDWLVAPDQTARALATGACSTLLASWRRGPPAPRGQA